MTLMTFIRLYFCAVLFFFATCSTSQLNLGPELSILCPSLVKKVWKHYAPRGSSKAGTFSISKQSTLQQCVEECCGEQSCNVVFMFNSTCFKIACYRDDLCEPVRKDDPKFTLSSMVLVRPTIQSTQFDDVTDNNDSDDMVTAGSENVNIRTCEPDDCGLHEICVPSKNSETSVCACQPGYGRNALSICVPNIG